MIPVPEIPFDKSSTGSDSRIDDSMWHNEASKRINLHMCHLFSRVKGLQNIRWTGRSRGDDNRFHLIWTVAVLNIAMLSQTLSRSKPLRIEISKSLQRGWFVLLSMLGCTGGRNGFTFERLFRHNRKTSNSTYEERRDGVTRAIAEISNILEPRFVSRVGVQLYPRKVHSNPVPIRRPTWLDRELKSIETCPSTTRTTLQDICELVKVSAETIQSLSKTILRDWHYQIRVLLLDKAPCQNMSHTELKKALTVVNKLMQTVQVFDCKMEGCRDEVKCHPYHLKRTPVHGESYVLSDIDKNARENSVTYTSLSRALPKRTRDWASSNILNGIISTNIQNANMDDLCPRSNVCVAMNCPSHGHKEATSMEIPISICLKNTPFWFIPYTLRNLIKHKIEMGVSLRVSDFNDIGRITDSTIHKYPTVDVWFSVIMRHRKQKNAASDGVSDWIAQRRQVFDCKHQTSAWVDRVLSYIERCDASEYIHPIERRVFGIPCNASTSDSARRKNPKKPRKHMGHVYRAGALLRTVTERVDVSADRCIDVSADRCIDVSSLCDIQPFHNVQLSDGTRLVTHNPTEFAYKCTVCSIYFDSPMCENEHMCSSEHINTVYTMYSSVNIRASMSDDAKDELSVYHRKHGHAGEMVTVAMCQPYHNRLCTYMGMSPLCDMQSVANRVTLLRGWNSQKAHLEVVTANRMLSNLHTLTEFASQVGKCEKVNACDICKESMRVSQLPVHVISLVGIPLLLTRSPSPDTVGVCRTCSNVVRHRLNTEISHARFKLVKKLLTYKVSDGCLRRLLQLCITACMRQSDSKCSCGRTGLELDDKVSEHIRQYVQMPRVTCQSCFRQTMSMSNLCRQMLLGGYAAGTVYDSLYRAVGFSCDGTQFSKMYNHVLEPPVQANLIALGNAPKKVVVRVIEYLTFTDTKNIMLAMSV
jgi:hypothetical protein